MYHHRAGKLKQSNKPHKAGGHTSNRELNRGTHGRVEKDRKEKQGGQQVVPGGRKSVKFMDLAAAGRANRLNHAKQIAASRRAESALLKRLGGGFGPPKVVAILRLGSNASGAGAAAQLLALADDACVAHDWQETGCPITATYATFRQRLLLALPPRPGQRVTVNTAQGAAAVLEADVSQSLAAVRAADVVLLVVCVAQGTEAVIDAAGDTLLSALKAGGIPSSGGAHSVVGVIQGLDEVSTSKAAELRKYATRMFHTEFGEGCRVVDAPNPLLAGGVVDASATSTTSGPALQLTRAVTALASGSLAWRGNRSYLVGQTASYQPSTQSLSVSGYLRGRPLNVHQLMCIPGAGVYQIERVVGRRDPFKAPNAGKAKRFPPSANVASASSNSAMETDSATARQAKQTEQVMYQPLLSLLGLFAARVRVLPAPSAAGPSSSPPPAAAAEDCDVVVLAESDPRFREPLEAVAAADPLQGEQTWPTKEELAEAHKAGAGSGSKIRRGLIDEDDEDDNEDSDADGDGDEDGAGDSLWNIDPADKAKAAEAKKRELAAAQESRERIKSQRRRAAVKKRGGEAEESDDDESDDDDGDGNDSDMDGARSRARSKASRASAGRSRGRAGTSHTAHTFADADANTDDGGSDFGDDDDISDAPPDPVELLKARSKALADEALFPDEIDTPTDVPARERFARYRGLKSFRTSPWDPKESLPTAYAHVFQFGHFPRTQRRVLGEAALAERALLTLEGRTAAAEKGAKKAARQGAAARALAGRHAASVSGGSTVAGSVKSGGKRSSAPSDADDAMDVEGDGDDNMDGEGGAAAGDADMDMASAPTSSLAAATEPSTLTDVLGPGWVAPGQYVTITLAAVPLAALAAARRAFPGTPLTLHALLRHENRASVLHFNLTRYPGYPAETAPVASREHLEFHVGPRVFDARPTFSQGGTGSWKSDGSNRAKFERYMPPAGWFSATAYGPVTYAPMPVLVYKRVPLPSAYADDADPATAAQALAPLTEAAAAKLYPAVDQVDPLAEGQPYKLQLVAHGSVVGADPDRVVLKRIVLSGYPIKVKRRHAVIRYMFFNPADVEYFKPVEVYTKMGLQGEITEPVGTHGHMKATFDRPIAQNDTVCMALYKRVYPRWGAGYLTDERLAAEREHL